MDLKELGQSCIEFFLSLWEKILDRIPEDKRRMFTYSLGGLVFLLIIMIVVALAGSGGRTENLQAIAANRGIPVDDLFYPEEPDFLPPLLLERLPGQAWAMDDLRQYWTDPGSGYEEKWREMAETVIDKLLEGVP
jgi:hypothetical protein